MLLTANRRVPGSSRHLSLQKPNCPACQSARPPPARTHQDTQIKTGFLRGLTRLIRVVSELAIVHRRSCERCVPPSVCVCVVVYLFEVSILALLPVHHVMEDGNHDVSDLHLRDQRHSQERTDHPGDEMDLILTYSRCTCISSSSISQPTNLICGQFNHIGRGTELVHRVLKWTEKLDFGNRNYCYSFAWQRC